MLSLVVVMAASCTSDTATEAADGADEQSSETTAVPEVETTTTAEPVVEDESLTAPDGAVATFTAAWGNAAGEQAWTFVSERCKRGPVAGYIEFVAGYAAENPGLVASNITAVIDGDTAAVNYDTHNGSGEFVQDYLSQPWIYSEGAWFHDDC